MGKDPRTIAVYDRHSKAGTIYFGISGTMVVLPHAHRCQQECGETVTSSEVGFDIHGQLQDIVSEEPTCVFVDGEAAWRKRNELHERAAKRQKC